MNKFDSHLDYTNMFKEDQLTLGFIFDRVLFQCSKLWGCGNRYESSCIQLEIWNTTG